MTPSRWWAAALLGVLLVGVAYTGWRTFFAPSERLGPIRGLVLGLGPAQSRAQLEVSGEGSYRTIAHPEDLILEWTPRDGSEGVRRAQMEFHTGQLVALTLEVPPSSPEARGPAIEIAPHSVLERQRNADGSFRVRWLARGCPTHLDEVASILGRQPSAR